MPGGIKNRAESHDCSIRTFHLSSASTDRGSHTGDTRVFRTSYAEHPAYVPAAQRAGALWDEIGGEVRATFPAFQLPAG